MNYSIHRMVIYLVNSVIHPLNNCVSSFLQQKWTSYADTSYAFLSFFVLFRVHTLLSSSNSMTFHDFFHDFFEFFKTLGLAVSFKSSKPLLKQFNRHKKLRRSPECVILPLPCQLQTIIYQTKLQIFLDCQGPTNSRQLNSMTFQAWKWNS